MSFISRTNAWHERAHSLAFQIKIDLKWIWFLSNLQATSIVAAWLFALPRGDHAWHSHLNGDLPKYSYTKSFEIVAVTSCNWTPVCGSTCESTCDGGGWLLPLHLNVNWNERKYLKNEIIIDWHLNEIIGFSVDFVRRYSVEKQLAVIVFSENARRGTPSFLFLPTIYLKKEIGNSCLNMHLHGRRTRTDHIHLGVLRARKFEEIH